MTKKFGVRAKNIHLERKLKIISKNLLKTIGKNGSKQVDIFLLSHREMTILKKKFLPKERGSANVLSFAEPKNWPVLNKKTRKLGEVYLNRDLAKGDAKELSRLLIHGVLHLLGYDHQKKNDRIKMERMEKKVIEQLDN